MECHALARPVRGLWRVAVRYNVSIAALLAVVPLAGYAVRATSHVAPAEPVAEVNGEPIGANYWRERVQLSRVNLEMALQQFQDYEDRFGLDTSRQQRDIQRCLRSSELLGEQVLNQVVSEAAIRQEARQRGITVTDEEVQAKADGSTRVFYHGTPVPYIIPAGFSFPTLTTEHLARASSAASGVSAERTASPDTFEGIDIREATVRSVYEHQLYREKLLAVLAKERTES